MQLPTITKQQQSILQLIFKFRFLQRTHIQTLLNHKIPNRINSWLKDLSDKKYLGKIQNNATKIQTNPNTYYVSKNGIKYLKTQPECQKEYISRIYSDNKRSDEFINKSLLIADIYISLLQKYRDTDEFTFYTQSDFTVDGIIKEIFPCFVYRKTEDKPYYVAEIFNESIPRFAVRAKISRYLKFFTQGDWIKNEQPPNILFICPNDELENYIFKKTSKLITDEDINLSIFVTTKDKILIHGIVSDVWMKVEKT
jgi:hypothetical protein